MKFGFVNIRLPWIAPTVALVPIVVAGIAWVVLSKTSATDIDRLKLSLSVGEVVTGLFAAGSGLAKALGWLHGRGAESEGRGETIETQTPVFVLSLVLLIVGTVLFVSGAASLPTCSVCVRE